MHVYTQDVPAAPRAPKAPPSIAGADSRGLSERERAVRGFRDAVDTKLLAALAEPARLAILEFLFLKGPSDVTAIAGPQTQERSVVSRHLRLLLAAGLVRVRQDGRRRVFELDGQGLLGRLDAMVSGARRIVMICCPPAGPTS